MHYSLGPLDLQPDQRVLFHGPEILPLAPKTFDLLLLLVVNAGEVVSRETLRQEIWPDSFVEEAVISRSISLLRSKLRTHLGDTEFIETVPKRGYRFVGEVRVVDPEAVPGPDAKLAGDVPSDRPANFPDATFSPEATLVAVPASTRWIRMAIAVALLIVIPCGLLAGLRIQTIHASVAKQPSIAVMDLQDLSASDATGWIGVALQAGLQSQLSEGHGALISAGDQVAMAERALGPRGARALSLADMHDVGEKLGARLLLTGTYIALNGQVRFDLTLREASTGKTVDQWSETVPQTQLNSASQKAVAHLRSILKLAPLKKPSSLPFSAADQVAAHYYAEGMDLSRTGDYSSLVAEALSKAIKADSQFAQAHAELSIALTRLGEGKAADEEAQLALETSAKLPENDKLLCQATAYAQLADYPKAVSALTQLHHLDPAKIEYTLRLAKQLYNTDQLPQALSLLLPLNDPQRNQPTDVRVSLALADIRKKQGDLRADLVSAGQALAQAKADGSHSEEAEALITSGRAWTGLGDFNRALQDLKQAEELFRAAENREGVISALLQQSTTMQEHDDPAAETVTRQALQAAEHSSEKPLIARAWLLLGNIELTHNREAAAAQSYLQAKTVAEPGHDSNLELAALSNLSTVEFAEHQIDAAMKDNQEALSLARQAGLPGTEARSLQQLGEIDRYLGNFASAEAHLRECLSIWQRLGQMLFANDVRYEIGELLLAQGKLQQAKKVFESIDTHTMSIGNASLLKTEQARLVAAEGNTQLAETMAADSARTANSPNYSMMALDLLAQLQLRQHKSAEAQATLAQMNDKLKLISTDKEAATRVQLLQARLDTDAGDIAAAQAILHQLQQVANVLKDKDLLLRVQLANGETEERAGRGNLALQTAAKDSRRSGFLLLADSVSAPLLP